MEQVSEKTQRALTTKNTKSTKTGNALRSLCSLQLKFSSPRSSRLSG